MHYDFITEQDDTCLKVFIYENGLFGYKRLLLECIKL